MPKTNKNGIFCTFSGKIDFENLLISEKQLEKLPLEQTIFSFGGDNKWEGYKKFS